MDSYLFYWITKCQKRIKKWILRIREPQFTKELLRKIIKTLNIQVKSKEFLIRILLFGYLLALVIIFILLLLKAGLIIKLYFLSIDFPGKTSAFLIQILIPLWVSWNIAAVIYGVYESTHKFKNFEALFFPSDENGYPDVICHFNPLYRCLWFLHSNVFKIKHVVPLSKLLIGFSSFPSVCLILILHFLTCRRAVNDENSISASSIFELLTLGQSDWAIYGINTTNIITSSALKRNLSLLACVLFPLCLILIFIAVGKIGFLLWPNPAIYTLVRCNNNFTRGFCSSYRWVGIKNFKNRHAVIFNKHNEKIGVATSSPDYGNTKVSDRQLFGKNKPQFFCVKKVSDHEIISVEKKLNLKKHKKMQKYARLVDRDWNKPLTKPKK